MKTTKYKYIQRFRLRNGVFGLNADSLGGTNSALNGIPPEYHHSYFDLLP